MPRCCCIRSVDTDLFSCPEFLPGMYTFMSDQGGEIFRCSKEGFVYATMLLYSFRFWVVWIGY
jgi:hypothetical protein